MTAGDWKNKTIEQMKSLDTYKAAFLPEIEAAAIVLSARDSAYEQYVDDGAEAVVEHVSDRGSVNMRRNPLLDAWLQLDKQALDHWKALGLTVESLKRIREDQLANQKTSALSEALSSLTNEPKRTKTLERSTKIRAGNTKRKKASVQGAKARNRKVSARSEKSAV